MKTKRATMRDVAAASGVSPSTVSFVLNGAANQTISPATRERVQRAAGELGYVPHAIARALREGSSRIVLLNLDQSFVGGSLDRYIRGLDDELARNGHVLLVRHGHTSPASLRSVVETASPRAVIDLAELYQSGGDPAADGGWINGLAAHTAVQLRYLAEKRHSAIAAVFPEDPQWAHLSEIRLGFAREVAESIGIRPVEALTLPTAATEQAAALREFLREKPVTALAAFDDRVALRLLSALHELELPDDERPAVIGFDDTEYGELSIPSLTSVHIDAEMFGRLAARNALGLDAGDLTPAAAQVVVRNSA